MDRLPIGRFARLCRLSVKALRHYDKLGILRPAWVDSTTGYRFYERSQLRRALAIAMLRTLEVPLESIREILDAGGDRAVRALQAEADRQSRELARKHTILASLERLVRDRTLAPYEVSVVSRQETLAAWTTETVPVDQQEVATTQMIRDLMASLTAAGIRWSDPVVCRFPGGRSDLLTLEVGVAVPAGTESEAHRIEPLAARRSAKVTHIGPYATLGLAHHALFAWARENGAEEAGPIEEVYVDDPDDTPPAALTTEVHLPLA
ncbi:MAG: MerR family transcriptional regulator [Myxococcota bacterium]